MMGYEKEEIKKTAVSVVNQKGFNKEISVLIREVSKELAKKEMDSIKNSSKQTDAKLNRESKKNKSSVPENFTQENIKDVLEGIS